MARLPEEFISQLKQANSIVDLFSAYADLKKRGRVYVCCCPFHAEKTPSCTIYPETHSFYCFGCGESGDVIKFLMKIDDLSYIDAVRTLAQRAGMTMPLQTNFQHKQQQPTISHDKCYEINRDTADFYHKLLLHRDNKSALQHLATDLRSCPQRPQT
ncbi:MAG: DNA primase, partial [Oscillospiraceae bacterium]|nr:DNA primase [Oscillospiraceae bacterium]